jgi:UPF0716 protein FxsA
MKFLFFILVMPVLELWLIIEIGSRIGAWYTIGLLFLSAILGIKLLQQQGFSTLLKINQKMAAGENPAEDALSGILLAVGGLMFLLPGFISDGIGLLCLFPPTRYLLVRYWLKQSGSIFVHVPVNKNMAEQSEDIIEGEFRREVPEDKRLS